MDQVDSLRSRIANNRAIIICGAGVAAATSNLRSASSWPALIESGIRYATDHTSADADFVEWVEADLRMADKQPRAFLSAAQKITDQLGGPSSGTFSSWLREAVGQAAPDRPELIEALNELNMPLATFNYDTLIEQITGRVSRSWQEPNEVRNAIQRETTDIVHLHGVWTVPDSVIFDSQSYGKILEDAAAQGLQNAFSAMTCLVFVGCGDGLGDANFGALRAWLRRTYPNSNLKHYRLCLDEEYTGLVSLHADEDIVPVAYGSSHPEIVPFLKSLQPAPQIIKVGQAVESAVSELAIRAREDAVLGEHMPDLASRPIGRLLSPPVILPVDHEQFAAAQRDDEGPRLERSDIDNDLATHSFIVLVGDDSSGLTSALRWMVQRASDLASPVTPLVVDYTTFKGKEPLTRSVRLGLRAANVPIGERDELPNCAIAIDNLMPSSRSVFKRTIDQIEGFSASHLVLGCRSAALPDLSTVLRQRGLNPLIRYIGRLNTTDIVRLAELVAPEPEATRLANRAVEILQREHLSRTPLTVCLLLSVLMHGEAFLSTASATALLDAYVSLLLGRGELADDSRFDLDAHERTSLLAALAEAFVQKDNGAVSEADVIACFEKYFQELAWHESPTDVLDNLVKRHVLVKRDGLVQFAQSSFLHLFAAHKAMESSAFRDELLLRPYYYAPIIKHYAALNRSDADLLRHVNDLVVGHLSIDSGPRGRNLSQMTQVETPELSKVESMIDAYASADGLPEEQDAADPAGEVDPLDAEVDQDAVPFPSTQIEEAPPLVQIIETLGLVSVVLRDSELVRNHALKREVLSNTLHLWGRLVDSLEKDELFNETMLSIVKTVVDGLEISPENRDDFIKLFCEMGPVLTSVTAMGQTLTSRKLFLTLLDLYKVPEFVRDPGSTLMGTFLSYSIGDEGWTRVLGPLQEQHGQVKAVASIVRPLTLHAYYHKNCQREDARNLLDFLSDQLSQGTEASTIEGKTRRSRIRQRLETNKLQISIQGPRRAREIGDGGAQQAPE